MMLIQTVTGNENWSSGSTTLGMFVCPTILYPLEGKEEFLWHAAKIAGRRGVRPQISQVGSSRQQSAGNGIRADIVGKWSTAVYDIPDNVLLKLNVRRSTAQPPTQKVANILLRAREGAGMKRIIINTLQNPNSTLDRAIIEGKFDILDLGQAAVMGFQPAQQYLPSYLASRWATLPFIGVQEVTQETSAAARPVKKTLQNSEGEKVQVVSSHKPRALDLD